MDNKLQRINALNTEIQYKYMRLPRRTFWNSFKAGLAAGIAARALFKDKEHDSMIVNLEKLNKNFP